MTRADWIGIGVVLGVFGAIFNNPVAAVVLGVFR